MRRNFKDWLKAYQEYTQHSEAPDAFHMWTGIGVIAGALRRKTHIDMGYFKWYPNFFICFVAPPGVVSKSTTMDIGMRLLRQVDGINFGPAASTWQALVQQLGSIGEQYPIEGNTGISVNQEFLEMSAMTVTVSELGTFINPQDTQQIDALVDLWDCKEGKWEKGSKMYGLETVTNPWLQLIGCTTPSWIANNFGNYFIGGGFASRTLFIYSDVKRNLVAYPSQHIPVGHDTLAQELIHDLKQIASLVGKYSITPAAYKWGTEWYIKHNSSDNPLRSDERTVGYFARKQTHLHKTAMVRAASQRNELVINLDDMIWADQELGKIEQSIRRVFGEMNKEDIVRIHSSVLSSIRAAGRIRKEKLFQEFMLTIGYDTFEKALATLYGAGLIETESAGGRVFIKLTGKVDTIAEQLTAASD